VQQILNELEARVVGSLIEKSLTTPDQYPMTLNALTSACNQKSARHPVMSMTQGEVQRTIRALEEKHFVVMEENFKSRTEKYAQRFCGTRYSGHQFDAAQVAVVCLLLLRGAQTPGELRTRSARLHTFADNGEVVVTLNSLIEREGEPLLVKLPRMPGRKDSEYMHLFCGPVDVEAHLSQAQSSSTGSSAARISSAELLQRLEKLEAEVADLKTRLS